MNILVVINPTSGGGKGAKLGSEIRSLLPHIGTSYAIIEESSRESSIRAIEEILSQETFTDLISVGGDGLIHDLIPFALTFGLNFLPIPAGTGNDFARTMGTYGKEPAELLRLINREAGSQIDVGSISHGESHTPFVQILSTGFDSVVNARANGFRRVRGTIKYVIAVLLEVWRFKPVEFRVRVDEEVISQRAMLVCVANGESYGAGMKIVPHANNQDGYLDVLVLDAVNPLRLLLVFPRVFIGKHVRHPKVHFYRGRTIEISGETQAYADGEFITNLPVQITLSKRRLKVTHP